DVVLQERLLDARAAGEEARGAGGEEAVARPAGALARGAVHKEVERVLAERLAPGLEEAVETLVAGGERGAVGLGVVVGAEPHGLDGARAVKHDEPEVAQRVRLHRLDLDRAGFDPAVEDVQAAEPARVDGPAREDLVEEDVEPRRLGAAEAEADEAGAVDPEVEQPERLRRDVERKRERRAGRRYLDETDGLPVERRRRLELLLAVALEVGAEAGDRPVAVGLG